MTKQKWELQTEVNTMNNELMDLAEERANQTDYAKRFALLVKMEVTESKMEKLKETIAK